MILLTFEHYFFQYIIQCINILLYDFFYTLVLGRLTEDELRSAMDEVLREVSEERELPDDSCSETDSEYVEEDIYSSDSEQSADEFDMDIEQNDQHDEAYRFFVGRDGETLWLSTPLPSSKT